jgi:type IV secretion system protein VirD4
LGGVILHSLYKRKLEGTAASLPIVDRMMSDSTRIARELWMEMASYKHINGENHPAIGGEAANMMKCPDEEAASVLSTLQSYLSLYRDPIIPRNVTGAPHDYP